MRMSAKAQAAISLHQGLKGKRVNWQPSSVQRTLLQTYSWDSKMVPIDGHLTRMVHLFLHLVRSAFTIMVPIARSYSNVQFQTTLLDLNTQEVPRMCGITLQRPRMEMSILAIGLRRAVKPRA